MCFLTVDKLPEFIPFLPYSEWVLYYGKPHGTPKSCIYMYIEEY